jgi:hypothetical protein
MTTDTMQLDFLPMLEEPDDSPETLQARFEAYHKANPDVYRLLVKFAREVRQTGRGQYGIAALFERLRWHYHIELKRDDDFKLNNNWKARYARLIMAQEPDLAEFFELRILRAD